jgi:hypothetical protein
VLLVSFILSFINGCFSMKYMNMVSYSSATVTFCDEEPQRTDELLVDSRFILLMPF